MPKGLPRAIIKKYGVTKKAWQVYRGKRTPTKKVIRVSAHRTTRSTMPKRKKFYRRSRKSYRRKKDKTFPLSFAPAILVPVTRIIAGDGAHLMGVAKAVQTGDISTIAKETGFSIAYETIGLDYDSSGNLTKFDWTIPARNLAMIFGGLLVHKFAAPINRKLKNVPYVGKYISI
jgi:hypothetical protein